MFRRGLLVAGPNLGEFSSDSSSSRKEKVPTPAGRVADGEGEQLLLFFGRGLRLLEPVLDDRDESTLDEFVHEFGRGVIGAGGLPLGAGQEVEGDLSFRLRKHRLELEQALVDASELLDIEGSIVDPPPGALSFSRYIERSHMA